MPLLFRSLFLSALLFLSTLSYAKTYDCFCFYNEFELLTVRLEELWNSVDYFVLVESIETQKGTLKPLYFQQNKQLFKKYLDKIIHIPVMEKHPEFTPWERENYQRNCIVRGIGNCKDHDLIMISDLDEIPRASLLPFIKEKLHNQHSSNLINSIGLQQEIYFFQLNRQTPTKETWGGGLWVGTVITTYKGLKKANPQYFRDHKSQFPLVYNAGWHFTWMGGKEMVRKKMASVVEGDNNVDHYTDEVIEQMFLKHPAVPIDNSFPKYIVDHINHFKSIGYIAH